MFGRKKILFRLILLISVPLLYWNYYFDLVENSYRINGNVFSEQSRKIKNGSLENIPVSKLEIETNFKPLTNDVDEINTKILPLFKIPISSIKYKIFATNNVTFRTLKGDQISTLLNTNINGKTVQVYADSISPHELIELYSNNKITNSFEYDESKAGASVYLSEKDTNYFYSIKPTSLSSIIFFLALIFIWHALLLLINQWYKFVTGEKIFNE